MDERRRNSQIIISQKLITKTGLYFGLILILIFILSSSIFAEKNVLKVPRLSSPPKIDGILDNPLWEQEALKIENFYQFVPKEKGKPSEKTIAYLGYDKKNLYLAFQCFDSQPDKIRFSVTQRDNIFMDDWIVIIIDTFNEKRRAFDFFVNPIGIQADGTRTEEGGNESEDQNWDTFFLSEGKITDQGYTVELAIPFKSLRFPNKKIKNWGLFLGRNIPRKGEIITWPAVSRSIQGLLIQTGNIVIEGEVERGKNLEIMPIFTSLLKDGEKIDPQPGVNVKYGLSSDLTFDFTLNPDFSHIEADAPQIDINQRYALYYSEKRPFFLEGREIFEFPSIEMVYTRRIIDPLWGGKFTGKIGKFTLGYLSAYDEHPTESLWAIHNGKGSEEEKALFNILRVKADVFKESYIGFALADKEIDGSYNRVGGLDGQFKFKNHFFFSFQAIGSKTKYHENLTGVTPALYAQFFYSSKHWSTGLTWKSIHPDFEASSGFVNRVDYRRLGGWLRYSLFPEKKFLNALHARINLNRMSDYDHNIITDQWLNLGLNLEFTQFSRLSVYYQNYMERYEDIDFHKKNLVVSGFTNLVRWVEFGGYFSLGDMINYDPDDPFLGWNHSLGIFANFKPSTRLQIEINYNKSTFWKERGRKQLWDYNVIRQKITYQLSKTLSMRAIVDYNHFYKKIYGSFLVSYILRPGTVFFLGYDDTFVQENGVYGRTNRSLFIKFSYWWRI
ncbi:MAG: DUF5916 domain-containing protein [Candidatus Aminicenantia bacterium]